MSKNIVIQEGGQGKQLTVDKLKTDLVGGGTCLWVPEDSTHLGTKTISENGTFQASDDGLDGYSEVTVSGIGSVTGTDPATGEDTTVTTGPTGELETTVLPHSIQVDTPPTVTTYVDGATIDFSGMVVKAYLKSGNLWTDNAHPNGIIPISELTLPVTIANGSEAAETEYESDGSITGSHIDSIAISAAITTGLEIGRMEEINAFWIIETYSETVQVAIVNGHYVVAADYSFTGVWIGQRSISGGGSGSMMSASSYTRNGKTVYYGTMLYPRFNVNENNHWIIPVNVATGDPSLADVAWEMVYRSQAHGNQEIPVQYVRSNGDTLESSFDITVT